MKAFYYLYALAGCCLMAGCQHDDSAKSTSAATTASAKPVLPQPFRYHKVIEVAPGMDFDVMSWGRGPAETGAYLILRSDSVDKQYTTTTGELDGKIVDVFNTDLDTDGNPEIFIQSQTADSTGYNKIDVYEYNDDNAHKLDFPKLTSKQKQGYHGGDDFAVKEGKLIRTFPVYDGDSRNAKATGLKRTLEYSFHSNDFSVKQLTTDTASTATQSSSKSKAGPAAAAQPTKTEAPAKEKSSQHSEHYSSHRHESRREKTRHHESRHHEESRHRNSSHHQESSKRHKRHRR